MLAVRQSTAFETAIGPVLDANGVAVTDCVVGDFKIKKTTGNFAALNASATLTHVSAGFYDLVLTTSDVDTVGVNVVAIDDTTNTCSPLYLQVVEEAVYDAVFAASAAGYQVPIWAAANSTVNLSATTIKTATDVEADTNELQTDWANGGRLDLILDARASQTSVDDLPTNAELATALAAADDAVLAAIAALNNPSTAQIATAVLTTAMTEAYRSAGATATLAQFCYEVIAHLGNSGIAGTTKTLKKLDTSTTAKTYTLDDANTPTAIVEAS